MGHPHCAMGVDVLYVLYSAMLKDFSVSVNLMNHQLLRFNFQLMSKNNCFSG